MPGSSPDLRRVEFLSGEPETITEAERTKLESQGNLGKFRLSCQCTVDHDMHVRVITRFSESGLDSPGDPPQDQVTPSRESSSARTIPTRYG
jgi:hypothetical protein